MKENKKFFDIRLVLTTSYLMVWNAKKRDTDKGHKPTDVLLLF